MKKPARVTIKEVASKAGVDRSTVSRVFSSPDVLKKETVQRVRLVASELGYVPNAAARTLRTGRNTNIALIVPDLTNPFIPPLVLAAQRAAERADYCVFIGNSNENPTREADLMARFSDQVAGAVIASARSHKSVIDGFAAEFPVVLINRDIETVPRVLIDTTQGMDEAVRHLAASGHRRIAYAGGPVQSWANEQRQQAVAGACARLSIEFVSHSVGKASFENGRGAVGKILDHDVTAVIAFDDIVAQGLLAGFADLGIKVPQEMSLIGCDDVLGAVTSPALTTISNRAAQAGEQGVELLLNLISRSVTSQSASEATLRILDTELVIRDTTGKPANSAIAV